MRFGYESHIGIGAEQRVIQMENTFGSVNESASTDGAELFSEDDSAESISSGSF